MKKSLVGLMRKCETVSRHLKYLAHPQRLLILCSLVDGEKTVGELEAACGASQSAVSQFLKAMRQEGFIDARRNGHFVHYRIADPRVVQVIKALHAAYD